ncbi:hypothetical protein CO657_04055 [Rhizobium acidisoli]|uniref:Uncharacterized protein n=1 Tax=Rhizobium acidisoli TaxID=1538158 RepID=A0AAE5WLW8_9HYPH|nr:hypothetical protein [Rhizobium acidisoli]KPH10310.1 hypothetical protein AOG23_02000 [Rhizobium acidisoli]QAS77300.1 hypothetical protein CO657_04055 [Rhizobium acidisoli]
MANLNMVKEAPPPTTRDKVSKSREDKNREKVIQESRDQYRRFLDSINQSSDREIDRAMSRM